jgi:hypothetical protein
MAHCSPLGEAATSAAEVENKDKVAVATEVEWTISENSTASDGDGCLSGPDAADDSLGKGGSDDENLRTYYFRSSTITVGKTYEMEEKGYFLEGKARAPGAENCAGAGQ